MEEKISYKLRKVKCPQDIGGCGRTYLKMLPVNSVTTEALCPQCFIKFRERLKNEQKTTGRAGTKVERSNGEIC